MKVTDTLFMARNKCLRSSIFEGARGCISPSRTSCDVNEGKWPPNGVSCASSTGLYEENVTRASVI
ncbi:uncharacterized protein PHALS_09307 [Plasmopara halstedii]|uniref:Uncharacterized protein n=1 Tax=Plasmopara halstedii TaxID=4781 RepID=A0A0P1AEJ0_PLAHL|nr:uncharacterized protein PHALS_09307 [Plasmopara halstedii]CEG39255.1 hypothetical protein PHALS_09307 [Plasmopara halstedii]|eukprot:XP_024575624.1 hypothetical protein PHALS_09307 [Plasmopara halstedii]